MARRNPGSSSRKAILPTKRHEPGSKVVILIDGMNLAYRAYYNKGYQNLNYKPLNGKSIPVGLYYGMVDMIRSWINRNAWRPEKIIIFWDGSRSKQRIESYPDYKGHRKDKDKKFLNRIERAKKLLHYMGVAQAIDPELEGDDMCYHLVKEYIVFNRIVIVSGDKDFDQLVNYDVSVFDPGRDRITVPALVGAHNYGLNVNQLVDFYCLVGDHSDNIKGYHGIGDVRAVKFLNQFGSIQSYLANSRAEFPGIADKEKLKKIWKRNRKLIDLRYFNEKYYPDLEVKYFRENKYPNFNEEKYLQFCNKYGLKTFRTQQFINNIKSWHEQ